MDLMEALGDLPEKNVEKVLTYRPPQKRTAFLVSKPFLAGISTAASLMLIVGLGVGVWSRQQKIETRPPQETQTTTVSETETRTETTAQVTTESQTTGKQTEESTKKPETTTISVLNSDQSQQPTSAAALLTTAFQTEPAASAAPQTDAAEVGTRQTTPLATSAHTAAPQTSMTARIQGRITPVTEQSTRNTPTDPPTTTVIVTTTQPRTDPTESNRPTEPTVPPWIDPTEPPPTDPTDPTEPGITNPSELIIPTDPNTKTEVFSGFHVSLGGPTGQTLRITPEPEDDDPEDFSLQYSIDGIDFKRVGTDYYSRHFCILSADGSREIHFGQQLRNDFYFDYIPYEDEQIYAWGDCPGFIRERATGWCSCIWDDGNYIMTAGCYKEDIPLLKRFHAIEE
jgi:hypothetical protein